MQKLASFLRVCNSSWLGKGGNLYITIYHKFRFSIWKLSSMFDMDSENHPFNLWRLKTEWLLPCMMPLYIRPYLFYPFETNEGSKQVHPKTFLTNKCEITMRCSKARRSHPLSLLWMFEQVYYFWECQWCIKAFYMSSFSNRTVTDSSRTLFI